MPDNPRESWWPWLAAAAALNCAVQIWWFTPKLLHQIDFDGMGYVGVARHLVDGHWREAVDAFRSPLISWLIALVAHPTSNIVLIGKMISVATCLLAIVLIFVFAHALWRSQLVAAVAALCFSFARGMLPLSIGFVSADLLFAVLVLLYFLILLRCLRHGAKLDWLALGGIHALTYLAKAFALPWLAFSTLVAVALNFERPRWKEALACLVLAACLPVAVAAGWGSVLHSKYGVFTTGSQLKTNLLQWTLGVRWDPTDKGYELLRDTSQSVDRYGVADPMPPGSSAWHYPLSARTLLPAIARTEHHLLPQAAKELLLVVTPGGWLAFLLGLGVLWKERERYPVEFRLAAIVAIDSVTLVLAYCMLAFDGRYILPIVPLILAVAAQFLVRGRQAEQPLALPARWRNLSLGLVVAGVIFTCVYWASPYQVITRDYQPSCYQAGRLLREASGSTLVAFGTGPYPEHGVGWEAGFKSAFFGEKQIVGFSAELPAPDQAAAALRDVQKSHADAVLLWGASGSERLAALRQSIEAAFPNLRATTLQDPVAGQVGWLLFLHPRPSQASLIQPDPRIAIMQKPLSHSSGLGFGMFLLDARGAEAESRIATRSLAASAGAGSLA